MPVEILAALIAAFIAGLVLALYALRQRVRAAEARMELVRLGQKLKNIGTEVAGSIAQAEAERDAALAILDALPTPVWRRGADQALAYCNRAYAAAVGRDPEDVVGEATELPGKAQAEASRALARRALESGEIRSERLHAVVAGERRLMELLEVPMSPKDQDPAEAGGEGAADGLGGTVGMALDRTASEELQSELKRHIAAHAEVLEALGSGIAIFGPDMRLKFFNTAYARLWDLEEEALKDEPHLNDIHELLRERRRLPEQSDFPAYKRDQVRLFSTLIEPLEDLLHLPDGSTLRLTATPHPFGGVLMSFEDVTDRLALESSYNTLIAVQRETLDHLFEGVAVYGADGRLKLFNPVYARLWGLAESFLEGEPHMREVIPQTRSYFDTPDDDWPDLMERILGKSTEPNARSRRRERADGSVVEWAQVPLPDGANLFTFLDVTDSTRVERALRERNEALETTDRLKSEFIANVSYELRTPLNAIVGFAEILENQYFGELNERQLEYSQAIVESSQRLHTLINDILDLATIEAGYLRLDLGEVELQPLLESVYNLGFERARNRGIELVLDCAPDIGTQTADELRLKQALFNLLSNAVKYTPEGGRVILSARRRDDGVEVSVADTGVGIADSDQDRIFESFERGSGGRQSGAGLGLSLVKRLIELHGGKVTLQSKAGEGTHVTCFIPENPPPQDSVVPDQTAPADAFAEPAAVPEAVAGQ
ncbi:MAG: PAS-domain containing protein [Kiloniellales bacterium]|nr:PAS-domain containing protein [Kiloniellales bacterium]